MSRSARSLASVLALTAVLYACVTGRGVSSFDVARSSTSARTDAPASVAVVGPSRTNIPAAPPTPPVPPPSTSCPSGTAAVPGGTYQMGERGDHVSDDDTGEFTTTCQILAASANARGGDWRPLCTGGDHVTVQPFCLDVTEVTTADYAACVKAGKCSGAHLTETGGAEAGKLAPEGACNFGVADRGTHPINCVDWDQATAYCAAANKRLPTEEEWEWAARGGPEGRPYPWGSAPPDAQACWSGGRVPAPPRKGTCPVGAFPEGDAVGGFHDMAGNVSEWTSSKYDDRDGGVSVSGRSARTDRGGGWGHTDAVLLSAPRRSYGGTPPWRRADLGFRCAK